MRNTKKPNLEKIKEALEHTGLKFEDTKEDWKTVQWCMNKMVDLVCAVVMEFPEGCKPPRSVYAVMAFAVRYIDVALVQLHNRDKQPLIERAVSRFDSWEQSKQADEEDILSIGDIIKKLRVFKK